MLKPRQKTWVSMLRSGHYPQTTNAYTILSDDKGYTACGVLCELAIEYAVIASYDPAQPMPIAVQNWVGIRVPYSAPFTLDDDGRTFSETADLIELHAGKLFAD